MGNYSLANWANFIDKAKERTDKKQYEDYSDDFVMMMREFKEKHGEDLERYYEYYQEASSQCFFYKNYALLSEEKAKQVLSRCKVMVLTANPIEKAIFHYMIIAQAKKIGKPERIRRIICENTVFFVLKWGSYWIAHVHQAETGANKDMGTSATIYGALKFFTPNVIISLGVAFGIDYLSQNIGDVIVSKRILPYSENKRDEDKVKPDRSQDKTIDKWLHVRLCNANSFLDSITYGDILTGGSVLSSFNEKDKICLGYTKADYIIGGEMEGNALFQYANADGIPGVVIKGICDWGVAKNDIFPEDLSMEERFKNSLQAFAMVCAVEKASILFSDSELFAEPKNANTMYLRKEQKVNRWCIVITERFFLLYRFFHIIAL